MTVVDARPVHCPPWCAVPHEDEDVVEAEAETGALVHECEVAAGFLPETRRCPGTVTRQAGGSWAVRIEDRDPHGSDAVDDTVVVLERYGPSGFELRLLPGEAREIAAALIRAADVELFKYSPRH